MKKNFLFLLVLVLCFCLPACGPAQNGSDDNQGSANTEIGTGNLTAREAAEILAFAEDFSNAVSERDAEGIFAMCKDEEAFFAIGGMKTEDGSLTYGLSSPWPWEKDQKILLAEDGTLDIIYYSRVSDPQIYANRETLLYEKAGGEYTATGIQSGLYSEASSRKAFNYLYGYGLPDFTEFTEAYQSQANMDPAKAKVFCDPAYAAMHQLNIEGATSEVTATEEGLARVTFTWEDGQAAVIMKQPGIRGEKGIWVATATGALMQ